MWGQNISPPLLKGPKSRFWLTGRSVHHSPPSQTQNRSPGTMHCLGRSNAGSIFRFVEGGVHSHPAWCCEQTQDGQLVHHLRFLCVPKNWPVSLGRLGARVVPCILMQCLGRSNAAGWVPFLVGGVSTSGECCWRVAVKCGARSYPCTTEMVPCLQIARRIRHAASPPARVPTWRRGGVPPPYQRSACHSISSAHIEFARLPEADRNAIMLYNTTFSDSGRRAN